MRLYFGRSDKPRLAEPANRLGPAKTLLNLLAFTLADRISLAPRRARVHRAVSLLNSNVRFDLQLLQRLNMPVNIVTLVRSQRVSFLQAAFRHDPYRFPFRRAGGLVVSTTMSVFTDDMRQMT